MTYQKSPVTVSLIKQAQALLQRHLPILLYATTDQVPALDADGDPLLIRVPAYEPLCLEAGGCQREVLGYLVTHPDNVPFLKAKSEGQCLPLNYTDAGRYV